MHWMTAKTRVSLNLFGLTEGWTCDIYVEVQFRRLFLGEEDDRKNCIQKKQ